MQVMQLKSTSLRRSQTTMCYKSASLSAKQILIDYFWECFNLKEQGHQIRSESRGTRSRVVALDGSLENI